MPDYRIPNLANACRLLKAAVQWGRPFRVAEAAVRLGVPRTTVIRIVHTLVGEGFLVQSEQGYQLGGALELLGLAAATTPDLAAVAKPALQRLAEQTRETSHLAVWNEGRALIVAVCDSPHPLRAASRPGTRAYAHASATGKVLLAGQPGEQLRAALPGLERKRLTARTITTLSGLRQELETVRAEGYAVDNEEYHEGVRCLAVPVWDARGKVCAAIGITAAATRFPATRNRPVYAQAKQAAKAIQRILLGGGDEREGK
ncbi:MAG: IclR family transcriptional regulator [Chthoniobacteraceae bacterium]